MKSLKILFSIKGKTEENLQEFDRLLFKGEIDVCKASKGIIGNFITSFLARNLQKHSNYQFGCPQKKEFIYAYDFPMSTDDDLPVYLLPLRGKFLVSGRFKGKVANSKQVLSLGSVEIYGNHI